MKVKIRCWWSRYEESVYREMGGKELREKWMKKELQQINNNKRTNEDLQ